LFNEKWHKRKQRQLLDRDVDDHVDDLDNDEYVDDVVHEDNDKHSI